MSALDPDDSMDFLDKDLYCTECGRREDRCRCEDDDGFYGETLAERNPGLK